MTRRPRDGGFDDLDPREKASLLGSLEGRLIDSIDRGRGEARLRSLLLALHAAAILVLAAAWVAVGGPDAVGFAVAALVACLGATSAPLLDNLLRVRRHRAGLQLVHAWQDKLAAGPPAAGTR